MTVEHGRRNVRFAMKRALIFDTNNWANPAYLQANELYGSYDVTLLRNGQIAYPASITVPHPDDEEDAKVRPSLPKYASSGICRRRHLFFGKVEQKEK